MHLNIELTGRCNQRCAYCSNPDRELSELGANEWLTIIREQGVSSVHLTGGEPLLYKELAPLLEGLHEMDVRASILSNGSVPKVVSRNRTAFARLRAAQVSLDSTDSLVHDKRRGFGGAHERAIETLRIFKDLTVPVSVSMVVDAETAPGVSAMADFCRSIGAKLILRPLAQIGRSTDSFRFDCSSLNGSADVVAPDPFGYGAPSIGGHVAQSTRGASGQFVF